MNEPSADYPERVKTILAGLGIHDEAIARRGLPMQIEALELEIVEIDAGGREHLLVPEAVRAWQRMRSNAADNGVVLSVVSAFRDLERQAAIVRRKLAAGLPLEAIFAASAPPGYSEHHTGRAVDIATPGVFPLEAEFENTDAFRWLESNGASFGFSLSYPRGNRHGFIYEPWHWLFSEP